MSTMKKISILLLSIIFIQTGLAAQEKMQLSLFCGVGISNCYGEYPKEYNSTVEFSFHPGVRFQVNEIFNSKMLFSLDFGYIQIAYKGFVDPTDTYFYNKYEFLTINPMIGTKLGETGYLSGGVYYAKSLEGNSYREYTDRWVSLSPKNDFGLVAEIGKDLGEYFTIGLQGRYGFTSIGETSDTKTWALHGRLCINLFKF
jgi:hypothetical protein